MLWQVQHLEAVVHRQRSRWSSCRQVWPSRSRLLHGHKHQLGPAIDNGWQRRQLANSCVRHLRQGSAALLQHCTSVATLGCCSLLLHWASVATLSSWSLLQRLCAGSATLGYWSRLLQLCICVACLRCCSLMLLQPEGLLAQILAMQSY